MTREQELELKVAELEAIADVRLKALEKTAAATRSKADELKLRRAIFLAGYERKAAYKPEFVPDPYDVVFDEELAEYGWEPGFYEMKCRECGDKTKIGSKHNWRCRACAAKAFFEI